MGWFTGSLFLFLPLRLCVVRVWMCCNSFCVHGICLCVVTEYSQSGSLPPLSFSLLFRIRWCGKKKYVSGFCFLFCWSLPAAPNLSQGKSVCVLFSITKKKMKLIIIKRKNIQKFNCYMTFYSQWVTQNDIAAAPHGRCGSGVWEREKTLFELETGM